jgi:hypothetical protein
MIVCFREGWCGFSRLWPLHDQVGHRRQNNPEPVVAEVQETGSGRGVPKKVEFGGAPVSHF